MFKFTPTQMAARGENAFIRRLDSALLARRVPGWGDGAAEERDAWLREAVARARLRGFTSEQGVVSYVLGAAFMDIGFEDRSPLLLQLLAAPLPELRRSHGMNDWVADQLRPGATPDSGDAAIRRSFAATEAWGRR